MVRRLCPNTVCLNKVCPNTVCLNKVWPNTVRLNALCLYVWFVTFLGLPLAVSQDIASLKKSLTHYAPFDQSYDAAYSLGDSKCYLKSGKELIAATSNDEVTLEQGKGRFGGGLHFLKKGKTYPLFQAADVLGFNKQSWNTTVSVWLKLDPDRDLEPGYCDPVQIVGDDSKKGFIFLEWSKDETPRFFRYAIRPLFPIWNPNNVQWADIPFDKRPMVQVEKAPFSREQWTHVVFTIDNVNNKSGQQRGELFINGEKKGAVESWDLTIDWNPASVQLVLGAAYVGYLDELSVFNRVLTPAEVKMLYKSETGISALVK